MNKRYQVFVSSTFLDLKDERRQVMQALLKLNCVPAGMELFNAKNQDQWELIQDVIDDSDYYVVIVGARYGSTTEEGISYTEKEYDYALSRGKNVLGFIHAHPGSIAIDKGEVTEEGRAKLAAFVKKVQGRPIVRWESAAELAGQVGLSVASEISRFPATGWVRGDQAMTPETAAEMRELRARVAQLEAEKALVTQERKQTDAEEDGLEDLAQGSDLYSIRYSYLHQNAWHRDDGDYEWDIIFQIIGPAFIDEAPVDLIEERIEADLLALARRKVREEGSPGSVSRASLSAYDADTILVHMRALGLLETGTRKRSVADKTMYLKLTSKGDRYLRQLMRIDRQSSTSVAHAPSTDVSTTPSTAPTASVAKKAAKKAAKRA